MKNQANAVGSKITHEKAIQLAVEMKNDGLSYERIAQNLKSLGYISPTTQKPVRPMSVRYMVVSQDESFVGWRRKVPGGRIKGTKNKEERLAGGVRPGVKTKKVELAPESIQEPTQEAPMAAVAEAPKVISRSKADMTDRVVKPSDFKEEIKVLLSIKDFSDAMKLRLIGAMANDEKEISISIQDLKIIGTQVRQSDSISA